MNPEQCCPEFDVQRWDAQTFDWDAKPFIKESIRTFFHIPFPPSIGKKVMKMWKQAQAAQAAEENMADILVLFNDPTAFRSDIYFAVTAAVPDVENVTLTGRFAAKVFDGPYNAVPKFMKQMNAALAEQNQQAQDYYIHYAYCPKCAKKFGHNHMILFAQLQ